MVVRTAAFAYAQYDFETAFNEAICMGTRNKVFGLEQKISGHTWTNSPIVLKQLNSIEPKGFAFGQAKGSMSIDFVVSNPWYNTFVFAENCMACLFPAGATPFVYTWLSTAVDCSKLVDSASIEIGVSQAGCCNCTVRVATGAIANTLSLRGSIGEPIRGTLDIAYTTDTITSLEACIASECIGRAAGEHEPFTFAHGTLSICQGGCCVAVVAELQSFDLSLNPNAELLYQHGCHHAVSAYRRVFEMSGSFTAPYINMSEINKVYAQIEDNCECLLREDPTLTLVFDNSGTLGAQRRITYTFTGILIKDHNTAAEPIEPIFETVNWQARNCVVTAENLSSARP